MAGARRLLHDENTLDTRRMAENGLGERPAGNPDAGIGVARRQFAQHTRRQHGIADTCGGNKENPHMKSASGARKKRNGTGATSRPDP